MLEITTEALVLDREPSGEYNSRVFLYTEKLGGVVARATSLRKLTSKMAAHLEPLTFSRVRLIQKEDAANFQIADALAFDRCAAWRESEEYLREGLRLISILKEGGFREDADGALWETLSNFFRNPPVAPLSGYGVKLISALGFDHRRALCGLCGTGRPKIFSVKQLAFYCQGCVEAYNYLS